MGTEASFVHGQSCVMLCRPGGVVAMHVLGGAHAAQKAARTLSAYFANLHVLCTPEMHILFARAGVASDSDIRNARTALWRVTAAAQTVKPLAVLCDDLSGQLEQWAMNDQLHSMLRQEFGYGWFSAGDFIGKQPR